MQHRSCVDISDASPRVTQTAALFCFLCYLLHMTAHSIIQHCQCCNQHNSKSCASHVGFSTGSCNCYLSGFLEVMQVPGRMVVNACVTRNYNVSHVSEF